LKSPKLILGIPIVNDASQFFSKRIFFNIL